MIKQQDISEFNASANDVILDVRDQQSYVEGHIQYAKNFPIDHLNADTLTQFDAQQPIYILCGGGTKAPRAAEFLESLDANREYVILTGGTRKAKSLNMTIVQGLDED